MSEIANNPNGGINSGAWSSAFPTVTCPDGTKDIANGIAPPCMGRDGKKPTGYSIPMSNRDVPETFTNVKCNDGSTQSVGSNPMGGRVDMPCRNNGGVSPNQDVQKPRTFIEMNQGYIIIAIVLVAGYFAYKKFKK